MGKFASAKRHPAAAAAKVKAATDSGSTETAAPPISAPKSSALLKKTSFKAKSAKPAIKVPKYAVPKSKALLTEPEPAPVSFEAVAKANQITAKVNALDKTAPGSTEPYRHIPKKEKIQKRHDTLMRKFDSALEQRRSVQLKAKAAKVQKKRQQKQKLSAVSRTTAQGVQTAMADLQALKSALPTLDDALPSLQSLFQLRGGSAGTSSLRTGVPKFDAQAKRTAAAAAAKLKANGEPRKVSKTTRTLNKKNEFMQRYNLFQKLSADKVFRANPREVIAAHIRNRQE